MSEEHEHIQPEVTLVKHFGNVEGCVALFQTNINSPVKLCKLTINTNNISVCVNEEVQYFKFNDKEVDAALLKYRASLEKDIDHKEVVSLFADLHKLLDKVEKRTYYMNNGSIITTMISPCISEPIFTDDGAYYIVASAVSDWWLKNNALKTVIDAIREHIPTFSPWKGKGDDFIALLSEESNKRSALLPKKYS